MQLIKLHKGLFRFIKKEFPNKKTYKEKRDFIRQIVKAYLKELLKLYKNVFLIFDLEYKKQKQQYKKYQQYKKDIQNAYRIIQWMIKQGENRTERKHIRRDFEKHGRLNKETEKMILRDIYGVK